MTSAATSPAAQPTPVERLEALFDALAELTGQRNAIDAKIVQIVAEIDRDGLWGATGARSISALVAWKTGASERNAKAIAAVAHRAEEFPRCVQGLGAGRLSLDQVGVIAEGAADGSDEHYAALASVATVSQLRKAISLEPKPEPEPKPDPRRSIRTNPGDGYTTYHITLPRLEAAKFDTALEASHEGLIARWEREQDPGDPAVPMPDLVDAFMALVETGWDREATRRPHGQHTAVAVHVDLKSKVAALHLGPLLGDDERRLLTCDATCEVWFELRGRVIGTGRATRTVNRRLRRALEHRDRCCVVPGCSATRGLHAHHLVHWEDGGLTEMANLVLLCPYHHRAHHRGLITITGPADQLTVTDDRGRLLTNQSLARTPTTPPPTVPPCPGPLGERAQWWWYQPFEPQPPPSAN
ncbi:HNH endonuclease signature motif containing protein [Mycolicibacterium smegmatis]|uniref:HNH endonuclease domain protein n=2 Tax=Mycolicibacterium smegmatis (strain ATCC 700084 / mc(2)155) TaxID=246196 RepID=A0QXS1_MYCS2|nr:HNH endonuclease signature motif containing protein [Mycolicibacterium smegmatis]ABK70524.1 HNH endonuclease domain protein [Mycolicibacterium smegmatis MC2 155]AFP39788.1 hypothetical protein MSMEI_3325 [Mycolicibacterium smegmatis MC2 155]AIU08545.1 hypothetical protein LJ00_16940 [Mycolicibacterium smegmatis MC2 155]AIU15170.1 hypothetical protein LI99_16945 [Mycolicibacterium smegmatis]AIU21793.1 hypothetical protein LI98_16950 [Mycolicibacterium smegmatis]